MSLRRDPESFAFLLKTYRKDYRYAARLIDSFTKYNADNIRLYVVGPRECKEKIEELISGECINIEYLNEEDFPDRQIEWDGLSPGYINQEIVKLSFWEKGLCENYFCLDSDGVFIREFHQDDFMADEKTPYTVIYDDNELLSDPYYYRGYWVLRQESLGRIRDSIGIRGDVWTCHGFQTFNAGVLRSMHDGFMAENGYSYADLMRISPYEFSWYNYYLQKSKAITIVPKGQIFKYFHLPEHYVLSCIGGTELKDLARGYVGIILNSNYTDGRESKYGELRDYHIQVPRRYRLFLLREITRSIVGDAKQALKRIARGTP